MSLRRSIKAALSGYVSARLSAKLKPARDIFERAVFQQSLARQVVALADDRKYDNPDRYELLYTIARQLLPDFSINDHGRLFLKDKTFRSYFERFNGDNFRNYERRWIAREMLRLVENVPGDLAECGVFEGATAYQLCEFATARGRQVHLFDSFAGLSNPGEHDGAFWRAGQLAASEQIVRKNLSGFDCFTTFAGYIPERFADVAGRVYAFVHVDVDLEQPTFDSLEFFYPRLSAGGVILLDDHGYDTCPGARKAALEYMADKKEPVIDLPTGQGLILKQQQAL